MTERLSHFIGARRPVGGAIQESLNPSNTDEVVALAPIGGADEIAEAVEAAQKALPSWSAASPEVRADVLDRAGSMILERRETLGKLLSREEGKTLAEGVGETARAGRIFKYFAGEALRRHGRTLESTRPDVDVQTYREAVGVFGLIAPWNFPIAIPAWKAAPALAFGNTVVLKPADLTPATASALAEILLEAGCPPGVFNMVFGGAEAGQALVEHSSVDGVSFTGSQGVGALVGLAAMKRQARVQLEMGGKNPLVILDDADLETAVTIALDGSFFSTGQRCTASSRLIVQSGIHDAFVEALGERVRTLRVGDALDPATQMGPAVSKAQMARSYDYLRDAVRAGGRLVAGGGAVTRGTPGYYVAPTLIADTDPEMRINNEEVFGPVATTVRVADFEEAMMVANRGDFGLSAGIATTSLRHAREFRRQIRAGMAMINLATAGVDYHTPFGGTRRSSYGAREQGFAAVDFYTQIKTVYLRS